MTHVYRFMLMPDARGPAVQPRSGTEVIISYRADNILSNASLERVARILISQAVLDWLIGDGDRMNGNFSLNALRNHLLVENLHEAVEWLNNFEEVSMHNLNDQHWACVWILFS